MLEGTIEAIVKDNRGSPGLTLRIWVPCHNRQFKNVNEEGKQEIESDEEINKRKSEWEHLHYGKVEINQSD